MKIESIIKRKLGTKVEIGDMTYFFNATDTEPRHLCEVTNQAHIDRFLSIKDGYRVPEGEEVKLSQENAVLIGSSLLPAVVTIAEGIELPLGDIVRDAFEFSGKPAEPAEQKTESAPAAEQKPEVETKELSRDALLAEAKALKIKSPHLFGNEKLAAVVAEAKAKA